MLYFHQRNRFEFDEKSRLIAYDFNSCCSMQLPTWLTECEFWINMFAYSHAMINPFIYITFNESFKSSFKKFLCCSNEIIPYEYSRNCKFSVEVKKETMIKERIFSLAIYRIWMERWKIIQYLNGITLPFRVSLNQNTYKCLRIGMQFISLMKLINFHIYKFEPNFWFWYFQMVKVSL